MKKNYQYTIHWTLEQVIDLIYDYLVDEADLDKNTSNLDKIEIEKHLTEPLVQNFINEWTEAGEDGDEEERVAERQNVIYETVCNIGLLIHTLPGYENEDNN